MSNEPPISLLNAPVLSRPLTITVAPSAYTVSPSRLSSKTVLEEAMASRNLVTNHDSTRQNLIVIPTSSGPIAVSDQVKKNLQQQVPAVPHPSLSGGQSSRVKQDESTLFKKSKGLFSKFRYQLLEVWSSGKVGLPAAFRVPVSKTGKAYRDPTELDSKYQPLFYPRLANYVMTRTTVGDSETDRPGGERRRGRDPTPQFVMLKNRRPNRWLGWIMHSFVKFSISHFMIEPVKKLFLTCVEQTPFYIGFWERNKIQFFLETKMFRCELCSIRLPYSEKKVTDHMNCKPHACMKSLYEYGLWPG